MPTTKAEDKPMTNGKPPVVSPRIAAGIAIVVTAVWSISFLADIFVKDYDPSPFIHFLMMAVAGAALGHGFLKTGGKNNNG